MPALLLPAAAIVSYLLGSIPFGYILVRMFRAEDIRQSGSGNIGATNVIRSGARGLGALTFLLDALKGYVAVAVAHELAILLVVTHGSILQRGSLAQAFTWAGAVAGVCAVLGHIFPLWLGFKGGKGVATAFGVGVALAPFAAMVSLAVFVALVLLTRIVSLSSIAAALAMPLAMFFVPAGVAAPPPLKDQSVLAPEPSHFVAHTAASPILIATVGVIAAIVIAKHHSNIRRLLSGTEYRFGSKRQPA
jgi:acyl phosphate:glycerol-3-phosphate acyltransferase